MMYSVEGIINAETVLAIRGGFSNGNLPDKTVVHVAPLIHHKKTRRWDMNPT